MVSKNKKANKSVKHQYFFDDFGWPTIAFIALIMVFCLMSYRSQIVLKYLNLVDVLYGVLLTVSIVSILTGVWRATLKWKYVNVALAVIWLIPFVLYVMSFAGPLFYFDFTW